MSDTQLIPGDIGQLEIILDTPAGWRQSDLITICCHPHPLHGGSMQNKVVHILAKSFLQLGSKVVRFNFRGVGQSEGKFDNGIGEQADLLAVVQWCRQNWPDAPSGLAGFSLGAFVAAMAHEKIAPQRLVLVAPPVDMYPDMISVQIKTRDWILIQGGQDEIVASQSVEDWATQQAISPKKLFFAEAGHFFHGKLNLIKEGIVDTWGKIHGIVGAVSDRDI